MLAYRRSKGINLIELLTALVIVSVLVLVAIPGLVSLIQRYRISAAADDLQYHLQFARTTAIEKNENVYVSFITGDTWCFGINSGSACTCTTPSGCSYGTVSYGSAQQLSLATSGMTGNAFYYEGSHGASSASATITYSLYSNGATLITISIGRFGNSQLCATGVSGYTAC